VKGKKLPCVNTPLNHLVSVKDVNQEMIYFQFDWSCNIGEPAVDMAVINYPNVQPSILILGKLTVYTLQSFIYPDTQYNKQ